MLESDGGLAHIEDPSVGRAFGRWCDDGQVYQSPASELRAELEVCWTMAVSEELQLTGVFPFRASWDESQYLISNTGHEANLYLPNETSSRFDRRPIIVPLPNAATFPCGGTLAANNHTLSHGPTRLHHRAAPCGIKRALIRGLGILTSQPHSSLVPSKLSRTPPRTERRHPTRPAAQPVPDGEGWGRCNGRGRVPAVRFLGP